MPKTDSKPIPHTNLDHIEMVRRTLAHRASPESTGTPGRDRSREMRAAAAKKRKRRKRK